MVGDVLTREGPLREAGWIKGRTAPARTISGQRQVAMVKSRPVVGTEAHVEAPSSFAADTLAAPPRSKLADDDADEAVWVGAYRLALAVAAVRLQHASERSTASRLQGQSVIVVHFRPGGVLPEIRLSESSGQSVLDEGALDLIRRAVLDVPAPVQNQPFSVVLPVLFETM